MFRYYPNITLFFRHNSARLENVKSQELTNTDLTKNKTVIIEAGASDEPYTCVASNVPGTDLNEYMTTVYVTEHSETATVPATVPNKEQNDNNLLLSKSIEAVACWYNTL